MDPSLVVETEEASRDRVVEEQTNVVNQALHHLRILNYMFFAAVYVAFLIGVFSERHSVNCNLSPEFGRNLGMCFGLGFVLFFCLFLLTMMGKQHLEPHLDSADIKLLAVLIFLAIAEAGLVIASSVIIIQMNASGCGRSIRLAAEFIGAGVFMSVLSALALLFYLYFILSNLLLAWNGRQDR